MDFLVTLGVAMLVLTLIITLGLVYGIVRVTRSAHVHARRVRIRLANALPASAFGRRLWWLSSRVDRVEELAYQARTLTAATPLAGEVDALAGQLGTGCAEVQNQLRAAAPLTGRLRDILIAKADTAIRELEMGANELVALAETAHEQHNASGAKNTGAEVARHATAFQAALRDLDEQARVERLVSEQAAQLTLQETSGHEWIPPRASDAHDTDPSQGLVANVEPDEQRGQSLDR